MFLSEAGIPVWPILLAIALLAGLKNRTAAVIAAVQIISTQLLVVYYPSDLQVILFCSLVIFCLICQLFKQVALRDFLFLGTVSQLAHLAGYWSHNQNVVTFEILLVCGLTASAFGNGNSGLRNMVSAVSRGGYRTGRHVSRFVAKAIRKDLEFHQE